MKLREFRPDRGETIEEFIVRARSHAETKKRIFIENEKPRTKILKVLRSTERGDLWEKGENGEWGMKKDTIARRARMGRVLTTTILSELEEEEYVKSFMGKECYLYTMITSKWD